MNGGSGVVVRWGLAVLCEARSPAHHTAVVPLCLPVAAPCLPPAAPAVGFPPVETRKEEPPAADGTPAVKESLVSLLVNDCLK